MKIEFESNNVNHNISLNKMSNVFGKVKRGLFISLSNENNDQPHPFNTCSSPFKILATGRICYGALLNIYSDL